MSETKIYPPPPDFAARALIDAATYASMYRDSVTNTEAFWAKQARERLKFVKVGEKSYTVIDGKPSEKALPGVAKAPAAASDHPWYGQLWESVRAADAGPSTSTSAK